MVSFAQLLGALGCFASAVSATSGASYTDNDVMYDISWEAKKDMPLAVSDATASTVNGMVYVIGGCDSSYNNSAVVNSSRPFHACTDMADYVMIYNPVADSWSNSRWKMVRYRHAAVVIGTEIFVVGGRDKDDKIITSVKKYSTTADSWKTVGEFSDATSDNAAFEHGGKIITCGGYNFDYSLVSASCHVYDPADNTTLFKTWASLAKGRGDFSIVKLDGGVYAYGGFDASLTALKTIESIGLNAPPFWVSLQATMVHGRGGFAAASVNGRLLAIGGGNSPTTKDAGASLRHVEAYNPKTATWADASQLAPIPNATFRFCGASVGEAVYIFGGQGAYSAQCDCYPAKAGVFVYNESLRTYTSDGSSHGFVAAVLALCALVALV